MMLMYAQCAISVPQCTLTVYVQYTLATLSLGLGNNRKSVKLSKSVTLGGKTIKKGSCFISKSFFFFFF